MSKTSTIVLDEAPLTIANVIRIARGETGVDLSPAGRNAVLAMLPIGSEGETVLDLGPMVDAVRRAVA